MTKPKTYIIILSITFILIIFFACNTQFWMKEYYQDKKSKTEKQKARLRDQWYECQNQTDVLNKTSCYQEYDIGWKEQTNLDLYVDNHFFETANDLLFALVLGLMCLTSTLLLIFITTIIDFYQYSFKKKNLEEEKL